LKLSHETSTHAKEFASRLHAMEDPQLRLSLRERFEEFCASAAHYKDSTSYNQSAERRALTRMQPELAALGI
jgi:hypothetical protein